VPGLSLPVPVLSTEPANTGDTPLLRVPGLGQGNVPIGRIRFDNTSFALKLAWQDGELGVRVGGTDQFVPFANNFILGFIMVLGDAPGS
jgi:hypothetical protein